MLGTIAPGMFQEILPGHPPITMVAGYEETMWVDANVDFPPDAVDRCGPTACRWSAGCALKKGGVRATARRWAPAR